MRKVSLSIFVAFVGLAIAFWVLGGSFDRKFWLDFLPGLIANLLILALGVLVIDNIFSKERLRKLKETNASQSRIVLFVTCRFAFQLLKHLGMATNEEVTETDLKLTFKFAREKLRAIDLARVFRDKLMRTDDREAFANDFSSTLMNQTEAISKSLDAIYPRPHPEVKELIEQLTEASASVSALKDYIAVFKKVNAGLAAQDQFKPEQIDLLTELTLDSMGPRLPQLQHCMEELCRRAEANELFLQLE